MIVDQYEEVLAELAKKNYLVHAPKSVKELKREYKELNDYPAFKLLNSSDLLFVWWFAARCSPIIDLPEEKRVLIACDKAYRVPSVAKARRAEYAALTFSDDIKAAITQMSGFDPGFRIQRMADDMHLMKQMQFIIRKDIRKATPDEVEAWMKAMIPARKTYDDILQRVERGGLGVEEMTNTSISLEDLTSDFMKQQLS